MYLFFSHPEGLVLEPGDVVTRLEVLRLGVLEGMPFFISDDGDWVEDLNDFLLDLPRTGRKSRNTWAAYARDIHLFLRWLTIRYGGMRSWRKVTPDDLQDYKAAREDPRSGMDVCARSWNRAAAALKALYRWGQSRGSIDRVPFTERELTITTSDGAERTVSTSDLVRSADQADAPPEFLNVEQFRFFRDRGLMNREGKRGRHALRNRAGAHLFVESGIRESESVILLWELPSESWLAELRRTGENVLEYEVPEGIAKRVKGRRTIVSRHAMEQLWKYVHLGRAERISQKTDYRAGEYTGIKRPLEVERISKTEFREIGSSRTRKIGRATVAERCRMVERRNGRWEPVAVFLSDRGAPMNGEAWWSVFRSAREICVAAGRADLGAVTPHMMRHTFSVNLLERLERERRKDHPPQIANREIDMVSSMTVVQRCLGHVSPLTTQVYLHEVQNRIEGGHNAVEVYFELLSEEPE